MASSSGGEDALPVVKKGSAGSVTLVDSLENPVEGLLGRGGRSLHLKQTPFERFYLQLEKLQAHRAQKDAEQTATQREHKHKQDSMLAEVQQDLRKAQSHLSMVTRLLSVWRPPTSQQLPTTTTGGQLGNPQQITFTRVRSKQANQQRAHLPLRRLMTERTETGGEGSETADTQRVLGTIMGWKSLQLQMAAQSVGRRGLALQRRTHLTHRFYRQLDLLRNVLGWRVALATGGGADTRTGIASLSCDYLPWPRHILFRAHTQQLPPWMVARRDLMRAPYQSAEVHADAQGHLAVTEGLLPADWFADVRDRAEQPTLTPAPAPTCACHDSQQACPRYTLFYAQLWDSALRHCRSVTPTTTTLPQAVLSVHARLFVSAWVLRQQLLGLRVALEASMGDRLGQRLSVAGDAARSSGLVLRQTGFEECPVRLTFPQSAAFPLCVQTARLRHGDFSAAQFMGPAGAEAKRDASTGSTSTSTSTSTATTPCAGAFSLRVNHQALLLCSLLCAHRTGPNHQLSPLRWMRALTHLPSGGSPQQLPVWRRSLALMDGDAVDVHADVAAGAVCVKGQGVSLCADVALARFPNTYRRGQNLLYHRPITRHSHPSLVPTGDSDHAPPSQYVETVVVPGMLSLTQRLCPVRVCLPPRLEYKQLLTQRPQRDAEGKRGSLAHVRSSKRRQISQSSEGGGVRAVATGGGATNDWTTARRQVLQRQNEVHWPSLHVSVLGWLAALCNHRALLDRLAGWVRAQGGFILSGDGTAVPARLVCGRVNTAGSSSEGGASKSTRSRRVPVLYGMHDTLHQQGVAAGDAGQLVTGAGDNAAVGVPVRTCRIGYVTVEAQAEDVEGTHQCSGSGCERSSGSVLVSAVQHLGTVQVWETVLWARCNGKERSCQLGDVGSVCALFLTAMSAE